MASFFLQLFALASPLFFQVVIDKVLVHRSMSTLDVLIVGLRGDRDVRSHSWRLAHLLFSPTPPTASTSNSARGCSVICWRCRSPISRRGGSAIRWRGCASLKISGNFLTSSALTLVIDLFFTFVFLAVMFYLLAVADLDRASRHFPFYIAISAVATPIFRQPAR